MVTVHIFSELKTSWKSVVFTNKVDNIWQIKRIAIRVMKFEAARLHFLGDIFDAVADFVASAPYYHRCRHCKTWKNSFIDPPPLHPIFFCLAPLWSHTLYILYFWPPSNPTSPPPPHPHPYLKKNERSLYIIILLFFKFSLYCNCIRR